MTSARDIVRALPTVHMEDLTWPEIGGALEHGAPVILPTGAIEQHGPHLPLSVDYLLPRGIAGDVARAVGALVAPPVTYGHKSYPRSGGGPFFPGTLGLDGATLTAVVRDILRELVRHGATRIVVLDGNYENLWFLNEACDLAWRDLKDTGLTLMCAQHWEFLTDATLAQVFPDTVPSIENEHAAVIETSLMLHYHRDLVREDLIPDNPAAEAPPYDVWPPRRAWVTDSGALISAKGASAEKGRIMAEQVTADIAAAVRDTFGLAG